MDCWTPVIIIKTFSVTQNIDHFITDQFTVYTSMYDRHLIITIIYLLLKLRSDFVRHRYLMCQVT